MSNKNKVSDSRFDEMLKNYCNRKPPMFLM